MRPGPAVVYYRKSTDRQEASIPRQRESVEAFAAQHYYLRIRQKDGQLAWGSPMWIDYTK